LIILFIAESWRERREFDSESTDELSRRIVATALDPARDAPKGTLRMHQHYELTLRGVELLIYCRPINERPSICS
jgi:hypothetical protein